uniref:Uncharacterized protein n=1 Tax=Mus musculus TaxID=10090 RepID=Q8C7M1_MOUSE|nr:unnamed protein product [Mus musculus]
MNTMHKVTETLPTSSWLSNSSRTNTARRQMSLKSHCPVTNKQRKERDGEVVQSALGTEGRKYPEHAQSQVVTNSGGLISSKREIRVAGGNRAWETPQSLKCWPHKHEDLSLIAKIYTLKVKFSSVHL